LAVTAIRARTRSSGYVQTTEVTPANDPAKNLSAGGKCLMGETNC